MILDSLLLFGLTKEMKRELMAAQVRQIHQTDSRVIVIELYSTERKAISLVLSAQNPPYLFAAPPKAKMKYIAAQTFCMTLRKHLESARISDISQIALDRVLRISFDRIEAEGAIVTKTLYAELIPSAPNLILTTDGRIIDVLVRGKKQHRDLAGGRAYELPEGSSRLAFTEFSEKEIADILRYGKNEDVTLREFLFSKWNGLSSLLFTTIAKRADISENTPMTEIGDNEIGRIAHVMATLSDVVKSSVGLFVTRVGNKEIPTLFAQNKTSRHISSISEWLAGITETEGNLIAVSAAELKKHIKSLIKKEERKRAKIAEEMKETKLLETYKLYGNLLSIYAYMKPSGNTLTVANPFDEEGGNITIPIEPEFSLIRNGQNYFKKYSRMKTRLAIGEEKLAECDMKLAYLQNAAYFADTIRDRASLESLREELKDSGISRYEKQEKKKKAKGKEAYEPERIILDGFTVYIGKNSRQNEYLTLKKAEKTDLWIHAKEIPGSHVVIATKGGIVPEETIEKAAAIAAFYSRGKDDAKVKIDCTQIKYVKKIPNAPAGLVSYTHHKTYVVVQRALEKS